VTFSTTPKGASLRVDGEEKGTTPATLKLRIGTYKVRLQHKGYKDHDETLEVKADGDAQIVQVALVRIEPPRDVTNSLGMKLKRIDAPAAGAVKARYFIGVYEVTQEQYAKVMGKSPAVFHKDNGGGPNHPVEMVSYNDAVKFCKALSELPEEKKA